MSNEKKYTPGPWTVSQNEPRPWRKARYVGGIKGGDNGRNVVNWGGISRARSDEAYANARLIAAAPELLEALKDAEWVLQGTVNAGRNTIADDQVLAKIRAAIAKALGND